MRPLTGQVLRCGGLLLRLLMAVALLAGLGTAALGWRLSQGPLHLPALARALERAVPPPAEGQTLSIGDAAIAWHGFREDRQAPLQLRLTAVQLRDAAGSVRQELPDATVSLALGELLRGRLSLFRIAIQAPSIVLERDETGGIALAMGRLRQEDPRPAEATPPAAADAPGGGLLGDLLDSPRHGERETWLGALREVDIQEGRLTILDRQLGLVWRLEQVDLALRRGAAGRMTLGGTAALRLPGQGQGMEVRLNGAVEGAGPTLSGEILIPRLEPARLAGLIPALAPLALFDAPLAVSLSGRFDGGARGAEPQLRLQVDSEGGRFTAQKLRVGFASLHLDATGSPTALRLEKLRLVPAAADPGAARARGRPPVLEASGEARLQDAAWIGSLIFGLDAVPAADLGDYWPAGLADGARKWLVENLTGGELRDGRFTLRAEAGADLSGLRVTRLDGTMQLQRGRVHWLRPIPPLEEVEARAEFGLDEIRIQLAGARQSGTALSSPGATIRLLNLDAGQEQAEIEAQLRGPVPDIVALIRHPRLKLFENRPLDLKQPGGQVEGMLRLGLPLLADIPNEALRVQAQMRITQMRLSDVLMGKRLERGTAELTVDTARLKASGEAQLAGIPTQLSLEMDFRPGNAAQVVERYRAEARPDASRIAEFGLDLEGFVSGPVGIRALVERRRSGESRVSIDANLRDSRMTLSPFAWQKAPGTPAAAQAELVVDHENLRAVDRFQVEAPQLRARGKVGFSAGNRLERVDIAEARVQDSRFTAEARPPAQAGAPWRFRASGPVLDLGPALAANAAADGDASDTPATGPSVSVEAQFDRVLLGGGRSLAGIQGRVTADPRGVLREARIAGQAGPGGAFDVTVLPQGGGRSLLLNAADAGALLRAFDILDQVEGGRLAVNARWDGNRPGATLTGTAEMADFSVREAEGVGKLLQALTVYGMFDAVRGPGLSFSRLEAPFRLTPRSLMVDEARAFSASLGVTARGTIPRQGGAIDLEGTIVPAYVLNSLLGQIPLLGRLFSPERGGGLLAATWQMQGPVQDPSVSVNPLAALTPGFLRGIFGGGTAGNAQR